MTVKNSFNTQPPEGGCWKESVDGSPIVVSTHSRPKAAAKSKQAKIFNALVSTHSRPKAAVQSLCRLARQFAVSTHSRPKAADNLRYI